MRTTMTLVKMIDVLEAMNKPLNENWKLNDTIISFDNQTLLDTIVLNCADFLPLFADPCMMKRMSDAWWRKWKSSFEKMFEVWEKEYEPLWDKNIFEEIHDDTIDKGYNYNKSTQNEIIDDDNTNQLTSKVTTDDNITRNSQTITNTESEETAHNSITNSVSAYDEMQKLVTHDASITNSDGNGNSSSNTQSNENATDDKIVDITQSIVGTDDRVTDRKGTSDTDMGNDRDYDHQMHQWGTYQASQKLLDSEFDVRYRLNLYERMAKIFANEMCIRVS